MEKVNQPVPMAKEQKELDNYARGIKNLKHKQRGN